MRTRTFVNSGIAVVLALTFAACGGGGGSDSPTSPGTGGGGNTGAIGATITITAAGVSPKEVTVSVGQRVQFVNNDSQAHTMNSDPHPTHGQCPGIDDVGFVAVGQTKATSNLNTARTCGYHDHNLFENTALQGTIRVQ
jgi:plastocyanin